MNKIILLVILTFVFSTASFANENKENIGHINYSMITGTFSGTVYNEGKMELVLTTFFYNKMGEIVGKYSIGGESNVTMGEFSNFRKEGGYTILVDWKDKYGDGVLRILFSADFELFYGVWGKQENETTFAWNGVKNAIK